MRTLSDKAWIKEDEEGVLITYGHEDVKQFINKIKARVHPREWDKIDEEAGDKLI